VSTDDVDFSQASLDTATGLMCVYNQVVVPVVGQERLLTCQHSEVDTCHLSYVTKYRTVEQHKCQEYFSKRCQTMFSKSAVEEVVEHCRLPFFPASPQFLPWLSFPSSSSLPALAKTVSDCVDSLMRLKWSIS